MRNLKNLCLRYKNQRDNPPEDMLFACRERMYVTYVRQGVGGVPSRSAIGEAGDGAQAQHRTAPQTLNRHTCFPFFTFRPLEMIQGNLGAQVCPLTCEARRADAAIAVHEVDACGIVQAGGRYALIYVDFTAGPCNGMTFRNK